MRWWGLAAIGLTCAGCSTRSPEATPAPPAPKPDAGAVVDDGLETQVVIMPWGDLSVTSKLDVSGRIEQVAFVFPLRTASPEAGAAPGDFYSSAIDMPPAVARQTIFASIAFDYSPHGFAPLGVYDVPLWDVHTSIRKEADVLAIDCSDKRPPPNEILPPGYIYMPPPDNCAPTMGIHAVDTAAPEFTKGRLTLSHNLTYYGAVYNGHVLLVAKSFINTLPNGTYAVPVARIPERPGILTPTALDVRSDATRGTITFTYKDFVEAPQ